METIDFVLTGCLFVCFVIQVFYYLYFFAKPLRYQKKNNKNKTVETVEIPSPGVSVIISSKNESQNLAQFLPSILEQDYDNFEVIVVNDGSTDESEEVLGKLERQYGNLYKTHIPVEAKNISHKKLALTVGIKAAKHDILLFTEANNQPLSKNWIKSMAGKFDSNTEIVLGFSRYNRWGFASNLAGFDNLLTGLKYLSKAIMKHPYMGIGTNLAYKKDLFFSKKGFSKYLKLQSGEDDLFINELANKTNTKVEISQESITQTNIESFEIWKDIKICREVTQSYYAGNEIRLWRFEYLIRFLFWGLAIASSIISWETMYIPAIAGFLFIIRFLILYNVINKSARMLLVKPYKFSLLIFDLLQPIFNIYFHFTKTFQGKNDYIWR
ncbi:MAG: glycosyltransferase [Candidatus Azobacteroides sp.]|nr:glycosyltransferase [Candidatus Azobacteroides sp.]